MAGLLKLLKRSMGTDQKENIDLKSIKTVFHGSMQLKMKMERPSRPTMPSGVIARWFFALPTFTIYAAIHPVRLPDVGFKSPPPILLC
jgi:hypothetical protein